MALKSTVVAGGKLVRVRSREVTAKDGRQFVFTDATIIGDHSLIEARVPDDLVDDMRLSVGADVLVVVELSTFRDDVQAQIIEALDPAVFLASFESIGA